jgi:hypothetical protein
VRRHAESFFRFTYRRNMPPLLPSTLTSDGGWGCMLRAAQMLMGHTLRVHLLGNGKIPVLDTSAPRLDHTHLPPTTHTHTPNTTPTTLTAYQPHHPTTPPPHHPTTPPVPAFLPLPHATCLCLQTGDCLRGGGAGLWPPVRPTAT